MKSNFTYLITEIFTCYPPLILHVGFSLFILCAFNSVFHISSFYSFVFSFKSFLFFTTNTSFADVPSEISILCECMSKVNFFNFIVIIILWQASELNL